MTRSTPTAGLALAVSLGLALTACSGSTTDAGTDAEAAAGATGAAEPASITLYTSEPQEKIDAVVSAFNEEHPEITVEVFRAGTGDLTARIESERASGAVQADVLLAADAATFEGYKDADLLAPYSPTEADAINPDVVDPDGFYVGTRIIPTVIAYNTTMVDEPPTSWQDLTDPQYAGKITMPNPDVSGAAAYNAAVWRGAPELGDAWLEGLAANEPVIAESNGPVSQAVASGTQPIGVVVDYLVRDLAAAGSPIAVSYPSEGVPYVAQPAGIFADSDEPEASAAFIDFLVGEAGQTLAVEQSYLPVRNDVGTPEGAPSMDDLAVLDADLAEVTAAKPEAVARFNELFS